MLQIDIFFELTDSLIENGFFFYPPRPETVKNLDVVTLQLEILLFLIFIIFSN
jgi:hypothetical protein